MIAFIAEIDPWEFDCKKESRKRIAKSINFYSTSLDGMLVHRRVTHSSEFAGTHLYT